MEWGATQHPAGRGPGTALCPHPGEGAAASAASPASCFAALPGGAAKDACKPGTTRARKGQGHVPAARRHVRERPASGPAGAATGCSGDSSWPTRAPEPRSGSAHSPRPLLPAASQGREEMLSQGTPCTAAPPAVQRPHACPFPTSCPAAGGQATACGCRTPSPPAPVLPRC